MPATRWRFLPQKLHRALRSAGSRTTSRVRSLSPSLPSLRRSWARTTHCSQTRHPRTGDQPPRCALVGPAERAHGLGSTLLDRALARRHVDDLVDPLVAKPEGTVASGDHRPRRPPPEPLNVAFDRGIDRFEHVLQLFGRGSASTLLLAGDALRSDATVPVDPRPGHLTSQHRDLVAQHEQFGVLGRCTSREQCKPPHHLAEHQIEQSQGHAPFIAARGLLRRTRSSAPTTDFLAPTRYS
jgi:hypothetical protein